METLTVTPRPAYSGPILSPEVVRHSCGCVVLYDNPFRDEPQPEGEVTEDLEPCLEHRPAIGLVELDDLAHYEHPAEWWPEDDEAAFLAFVEAHERDAANEQAGRPPGS